MIDLRNALAALAAIEARATDYVNAGEAIASAGLVLLKASAAALESLHERLLALEEAAGLIPPGTPAVQSDAAQAVEAAPPAVERLPVIITPGPGAAEAPEA